MQIDIAVLDDIDAHPTDNDFIRHITTGKMRFRIEFDEADRGKIGYIRSTWETRAGKLNPRSDPVRFNII